ncbi:autotransporter outer membrane beta-barrel domain-containing protein [Pseudomonas japonica]|uniref:Outer membrane autotransporter barrel domain-containing protein n=1 Tax=Pseudomonas japonica TaxID=256466 RepID=A0A239JF15_9PSED|nr:autotransporter domain-containing protein [Pseudomonas japonica]SNT04626.1 outer membrane autotransporter barrel domain-containing protein [Pseudomonas japonica]
MLFTPHRLALCVALASASFTPNVLAKDYSISSATSDTLELKKGDNLSVSAKGSIVSSKDDGVILPKQTSGTTMTVSNAGVIRSTVARGIDSKDAGEDASAWVISNKAGALIQGTNDGLRLQTNPSAGGTLKIDNAGTIESITDGQAIDLETLNNPKFTTTLVNQASGVIHSVGNDAIKTGSNAVVTNYGRIYTDTAPQDKNGQDQKFDGIKIGTSTGVTVYNYGSISADRHGVDLKTDATLYNHGEVTGRNGSGFGSDGSGTVFNYAGGVITGAIASGKINGDGDGVDIDLIGHIYNEGTIQGLGAKGVDSGGRPNGSEGIAMGGGSIVNTASGVIRSVDNGILVDDGAEGPGKGSTSITNQGRIAGEGGFGIKLIGEWDDTVINGGSISGGNGLALSLGAGNDSLTVLTGGVFTGLVDAGEGIDTLTLNGSGRFGNSANFEKLVVSGGAWTLGSTNDFSQGGSVLAGATLINQGSILGAMRVEAGGVYAGGGSVGGLTVNGRLLTNTGLGVARVNGDLNFGRGASLMYGVNADGSSAPISVTGTAHLNGATLNVQPSAGEYPWKSQYTVLTAGAVDGTFAKVVSDYAFLTPTLSYSNTTVGLTYTRNDVTFEQYTQTANGGAAAHALGSLGSDSRLYNALLNTSTGSAGGAIEQLSGSHSANLAGATLSGSAQVGGSMLGAMQSMGSNAGLLVGLNAQETPVLAATGLPQGVRNLNDPNARGRLWLQALGSYGKVDGSHGGSALEQRTGGAVMGLDWAVGSDWRLGVLGGYSRTRLDATGLDGKVNSWHAGVYAARQSGPLALRLGAAYSGHDGDSKRDVGFNGFSERLKGGYDADSQQAFAELGYALGSGRFSAEPFANLGYQRYHRDGYREKGGNAALAVDKDTQDNVSSTFGVRVAHLGQLDNGMSLTPRASLGWRHVYGEVDSRTRQAFIAGGDAFSVEGSALDRDSLVLEAGLELGLSATQSVGLGYSGELGSNSRNHAVMGQWQLKF